MSVAPTGLTASVSHDAVSLSWDDPGDGSITGYAILRRMTDFQDPGVFDTIVSSTGSAGTSYVDRTVTPETRYVYRIKAINSVGLSRQSSYAATDTSADTAAAKGDRAVGSPRFDGHRV